MSEKRKLALSSLSLQSLPLLLIGYKCVLVLGSNHFSTAFFKNLKSVPLRLCFAPYVVAVAY